MPETRREFLLELGLVLGVEAVLLALTLGHGELRTYDEALYGAHARNAIATGVWSVPVDTAGELSTQFTKPPLSIWLVAVSFQLLGVSVVSLRVPFALAQLGLVAIAFVWGRRIGGAPMGLAWGLGLGLCDAATRWGRVACIEPLFVAPCMLALFAHARAVEDPGSRRWPVAAGLGLALALFAKQLAVGLACVPIVLVEAVRRASAAQRNRRLAVVFGIPLGLGAIWVALAHRTAGSAWFEQLVGVGIVQRVRGFDEGQNARQLNEIATLLDDSGQPLPWELGAVGLGAWVFVALARRRQEGTPLPADLSLVWFAVATAIVYDNLSGSLLPWYALDLLVPLVGGLAWLVGSLVRGPLGSPLALAGAIAIALVCSRAATDVVSRVDVVALGVAIAVLVLARARAEQARLAWAAAVLALVAMVAHRLRDPAVWDEPSRFAAAMAELDRRGISDVGLAHDLDLGSRKLAVTHFGVGVRTQANAPWGGRGPIAHVEAVDLPREFELPAGLELVQSPGTALWLGDPRHAPLGNDTIARLLESGGLTFEAEALRSERADTRLADPSADGGLVRARVPWWAEAIEPFRLSLGPSLALPEGEYTATLRLRWRCAGIGRPVATVEVAAGERSKRLDVGCDEVDDGGEWTDVAVPVVVDRARTLSMRLVHRRGALWHDWTRITRRR